MCKCRPEVRTPCCGSKACHGDGKDCVWCNPNIKSSLNCECPSHHEHGRKGSAGCRICKLEEALKSAFHRESCPQRGTGICNECIEGIKKMEACFL